VNQAVYHIQRMALMAFAQGVSDMMTDVSRLFRGVIVNLDCEPRGRFGAFKIVYGQ
jgi:hypothetical protein